MTKALKRVEAFVAGLGPHAEVNNDRAQVAYVRDLRAVLALAKEAAGLRRRVRMARLALELIDPRKDGNSAATANFG